MRASLCSRDLDLAVGRELDHIFELEVGGGAGRDLPVPHHVVGDLVLRDDVARRVARVRVVAVAARRRGRGRLVAVSLLRLGPGLQHGGRGLDRHDLDALVVALGQHVRHHQADGGGLGVLDDGEVRVGDGLGAAREVAALGGAVSVDRPVRHAHGRVNAEEVAEALARRHVVDGGGAHEGTVQEDVHLGAGQQREVGRVARQGLQVGGLAQGRRGVVAERGPQADDGHRHLVRLVVRVDGRRALDREGRARARALHLGSGRGGLRQGRRLLLPLVLVQRRRRFGEHLSLHVQLEAGSRAARRVAHAARLGHGALHRGVNDLGPLETHVLRGQHRGHAAHGGLRGGQHDARALPVLVRGLVDQAKVGQLQGAVLAVDAHVVARRPRGVADLVGHEQDHLTGRRGVDGDRHVVRRARARPAGASQRMKLRLHRADLLVDLAHLAVDLVAALVGGLHAGRVCVQQLVHELEVQHLRHHTARARARRGRGLAGDAVGHDAVGVVVHELDRLVDLIARLVQLAAAVLQLGRLDMQRLGAVLGGCRVTRGLPALGFDGLDVLGEADLQDGHVAGALDADRVLVDLGRHLLHDDIEQAGRLRLNHDAARHLGAVAKDGDGGHGALAHFTCDDGRLVIVGLVVRGRACRGRHGAALLLAKMRLPARTCCGRSNTRTSASYALCGGRNGE
mmetsp:Transcript_3858/g.10587  ORF Transcript_3858/g.10587 Transcript_3858/m.10587 type:complete len:682 (+) Transcript_3858:279-2324(+)